VIPEGLHEFSGGWNSYIISLCNNAAKANDVDGNAGRVYDLIAELQTFAIKLNELADARLWKIVDEYTDVMKRLHAQMLDVKG
jgi:hypothetical protein